MSYDADQWLERYKIVKTKVQSKRQAGMLSFYSLIR